MSGAMEIGFSQRIRFEWPEHAMIDLDVSPRLEFLRQGLDQEIVILGLGDLAAGG